MGRTVKTVSFVAIICVWVLCFETRSCFAHGSDDETKENFHVKAEDYLTKAEEYLKDAKDRGESWADWASSKISGLGGAQPERKAMEYTQGVTNKGSGVVGDTANWISEKSDKAKNMASENVEQVTNWASEKGGNELKNTMNYAVDKANDATDVTSEAFDSSKFKVGAMYTDAKGSVAEKAKAKAAKETVSQSTGGVAEL